MPGRLFRRKGQSRVQRRTLEPCFKRFALPQSGDAEETVMNSQSHETVKSSLDDRAKAPVNVAWTLETSVKAAVLTNVARSPAPDASPPSSSQFRQLLAE
jgi:hypothetical protein